MVVKYAKVGDMVFGRDLPAANFIGVKPIAEEETDLIAKLRSCFRYQDHSKEELLKAIEVLRPTVHPLNWPYIQLRQELTLVFHNPTTEPVSVTGMIAGEIRFEQV